MGKISCENVICCLLRGVVYFLLSIVTIYSVTDLNLENFDLIINFTQTEPREFDLPGITVCAPAIISPERLIQLAPSYRKWYNVYTENNASFTEMVDLFRYFESREIKKRSLKRLIENLSVKQEHIIRSCQFQPLSFRSIDESSRYLPRINCSFFKPVVESIFFGRKCFTFYSGLNDWSDKWKRYLPHPTSAGLPVESSGHNQFIDYPSYMNFCKTAFTKMVFDFNPGIDFQLGIEKNIWKFWSDPKYILFTVHPADVFPKIIDFTDYHLYANHFHEITFTKRQINLIGLISCESYQSNALYYSGFRLRNNDECQNICIVLDCAFNTSCYQYYNFINLNNLRGPQQQLPICPHDNQNYSEYLRSREFCDRQCTKECFLISYETTFTKTPIRSKSPISSNYAEVHLRLASWPVQHISYSTKMTYNEYSGILGGSIGLWLGLSALSIYRFFAGVFVWILKIIFQCFCLHKFCRILMSKFEKN